MLVNFSTHFSSGMPYCRPTEMAMEKASHAGQRRALLAELEEHLAHAVVGVAGDGHVAFGAGDGEPGHGGGPLPGQPPADRPVLVRPPRRGWRPIVPGAGRGLGYRQRLPDLAVVPVDRERLQAQLPALQVDVLHVLHGPAFRHVHGLGDRAAEEGLNRGHHPHMSIGAIDRSPMAQSKTG